MQALIYLLEFHKRSVSSVILLTFSAVIVEAISTHFLPMIVLEIGFNNLTTTLVLAFLNILLCGVDVALSPLLTKRAELNSSSICNEFRRNMVRNYLENMSDKSGEDYKAALLIATDHLSEILQDNVSQMAYRLIYGVGSFVVVLIIRPKFFLLILAVGIVVIMSRVFVQPKLDVLYISRAQQKKAVLSFFSILLGNQFAYSNPDVALRSIECFNATEELNRKKSISIIQVRGKLQSLVSFSCDLLLLLLVFWGATGKTGGVGLLFAIRPMINFFNYINITILSIKENLSVVSDFLSLCVEGKSLKKSLLEETVQPSAITEKHSDGISILNMTFAYDNKTLFDNFSFEFSYGNIYEIRGARGSGKTTLLKLIYNLVSPDKGIIMIDGVQNCHLGNIEDVCFYLPSSATPFLLDIDDNILLGKKRPDGFLDTLNALGFSNNINKSCKNLSTGEQLRLAMARGFISKKRIFLLDEFNANLDNRTSEHILQMLHNRAKNGDLIILVNHKENIPGAIKIELGS